VVDWIYPVGSVIQQTDAEAGDPNVRYPGTTWDRVEGQFLLASGTHNDGTDEQTFASKSVGGKYNHTLTAAEIPEHTHPLNAYRINVADNPGDHVLKSIVDDTIPEGGLSSRPKDTFANENGGGSHNNMPPYVVVDTWYRVA